MVMTRLTPADAARSSTAGRSSRNRSSSRWACVSTSSTGTLAHGGMGFGVSGRELLERLQVPPFHIHNILDQGPRFGILDVVEDLREMIHRFPRMIGHQREQVLEGDIGARGELHGKGAQVGNPLPAAGEKAGQGRGPFAFLDGQFLELGQGLEFLGGGPGEGFAEVLQQRAALAPDNVVEQLGLESGIAHCRFPFAAGAALPFFCFPSPFGAGAPRAGVPLICGTTGGGGFALTRWKRSTPCAESFASGSQKIPRKKTRAASSEA